VELLDSSAALKVLATRRAALRVYGEHEFPVLPLPLPDSRQMHSLEDLLSNPAVALFSQRAAAVQTGFQDHRGECTHGSRNLFESGWPAAGD